MTDQISETGKKFLLELFRQTEGKNSAKVSMYEVGAAIGTDKQESKRISEEFMSWNLIEIRTLSGGIAITDDGIRKARETGAIGGTKAVVTLGNAAISDEAVCKASENLIAVLKSGIGKIGADFELLSELMADLKTAEAQLFSPKPKTAIIRECFRSVLCVLEKIGTKEYAAQVRNLLG